MQCTSVVLMPPPPLKNIRLTYTVANLSLFGNGFHRIIECDIPGTNTGYKSKHLLIKVIARVRSS